MLKSNPLNTAVRLPAFTLLELMIATVLGAILLLAASALFMTFMVGNASTNARRQMSAEGTQMLGTLEFHIRNAKNAKVGSSAADGECRGNSGKYLVLTKLDNNNLSACFHPAANPNGLYFDRTSANCSIVDSNRLNSTFVILHGTGYGPYQFTCTQASNGKQTIKIEFTLGPSEDASIQSPFTTTVQLRNS